MVRHRQHMQGSPIPERSSHARIVTLPDEAHFLDTVQLNRMEESFRSWAEGSPRADIRLSRRRILLIFLLIRYTGAKLNEVLALNPFQAVDLKRQEVLLGKAEARDGRLPRKVQIPESLTEELRTTLSDPALRKYLYTLFKVDPGHVRRKFYERALDCGFPPSMGSPEMIRKSRAVELIQSSMPLPVVQRILGHSTLNMTASYVAFSDDDIRQVAQYFIERNPGGRRARETAFSARFGQSKKGIYRQRCR